MALVALATLAVHTEAATWTKVLRHLDDNCAFPYVVSMYKTDVCYRQNGAKDASGFDFVKYEIKDGAEVFEATQSQASIKFTPDNKALRYSNSQCSGTGTIVVTTKNKCEAGMKIQESGIVDSAVSDDSMSDAMEVVTVTFPNAVAHTSDVGCTSSSDIRYDIYPPQNPENGYNSENQCYFGHSTWRTTVKQNVSYSYYFGCLSPVSSPDDKGGTHVVYASYKREFEYFKPNCISKEAEGIYENKILTIDDTTPQCAQYDGNQPPHYTLGCGNTAKAMKLLKAGGKPLTDTNPGPFKETPWGWISPPPPSPPPPPPPLPPPPPSPPPIPPSTTTIIVDEAETRNTALWIGLPALGLVIALFLILYIIWRSLQRVIVKDMKHLRKIMLKMDKQGTDEVDTADFCRAFNMPMDVWTNRLVRMMDQSATGFISFDGLISGLARFHDCKGTRGVNVAFRLMDHDGEGSVARNDLISVLRAVLPQVQKQKGVIDRDAYSTRKVMTFCKSIGKEVMVDDFEALETNFPGIFKGALGIYLQFKAVFVPCKELLEKGEDGDLDGTMSGDGNKVHPDSSGDLGAGSGGSFIGNLRLPRLPRELDPVSYLPMKGKKQVV